MSYAPYAWKIIYDAMADEGYKAPGNMNARGLAGPRGIDPSLEARLDTAIAMGRKKYYAEHAGPDRSPLVEWFKIFDDDGEFYYTGVRTGEAEEFGTENGFEPLVDFGAPNAGATEIRYYIADDDKWETL